jgi:hypothetical protein
VTDERKVPDGFTTHAELSLRERMPEYLVIFAIGLAVGIVAGIVVGAFSDVGYGSAIGYTVVLMGAGFMIAGGIPGSGVYAGGFGRIFSGGADPAGQSGGSSAAGRGPDEAGDIDLGSPSEVRRRMQRRLRYEKNPTAFWLVTGGVAYVAIGLLIAANFGSG